MPSPRNLIFVTGNAKKLKEVIEIVGAQFPFKITNQKIDLPEPQGEADDISRTKCLTANELTDGDSAVMVEDTCLCFNALKGLPGPYVKWFLDKLGADGLHKMLAAYEDKSAEAVCTFAFCEPGSSNVQLFKGVVKGTIVEPRGNDGFGWDPCFLPDGYDKTFGEMSSVEKHHISHRGRAVENLRDHFISLEESKEKSISTKSISNGKSPKKLKRKIFEVDGEPIEKKIKITEDLTIESS